MLWNCTKVVVSIVVDVGCGENDVVIESKYESRVSVARIKFVVVLTLLLFWQLMFYTTVCVIYCEISQ